jgi:hypothetical protein
VPSNPALGDALQGTEVSGSGGLDCLPAGAGGGTAEEAGERTGRGCGGIMMIWGIGVTGIEDPGSRIAGFLFLDTIACPR